MVAKTPSTIELQSHYAYAYSLLEDKDYKNAIQAFKYSIKNKTEADKSIIGLICAYSCLGKYSAALNVYNTHESQLLLKKETRHLLCIKLSHYIDIDSTILKKIRSKYIASIYFNRVYNRFIQEYDKNKSSMVAIILISFWYYNIGRRPNDSSKVLEKCLYLPYLDENFRWKLLERLSITNKALIEDSDIANKFNHVPKNMTDSNYANQIVLSSLFKDDFPGAQSKIELLREDGFLFTNEVMWNYIKLANETNDIDITCIFFAKTLLNHGWVDKYVATTIRYGYENQTSYASKSDIEKLDLYSI